MANILSSDCRYESLSSSDTALSERISKCYELVYIHIVTYIYVYLCYIFNYS